MGKTRSVKKTRRGLSLVEMLIGIACLGLLSMAVLSVLTASHKVTRQAEARQVAMSVARQHLESLRQTQPENRRAAVDMPFTIPAEALAQFPSGANGIQMTGLYTVAQTNARMHQITVRVRWKNETSNNFEPRSEVVLSTFATSPGNGDLGRTGTNTFDYFEAPPPPPPPPAPVLPTVTTPITTPGTGGGTTPGGSTGGGTQPGTTRPPTTTPPTTTPPTTKRPTTTPPSTKPPTTKPPNTTPPPTTKPPTTTPPVANPPTTSPSTPPATSSEVSFEFGDVGSKWALTIFGT